MFGIIYVAKCLLSNKVYVGKTTRSLEIRKRQHIASRNCTDTKFSRAIRKYGCNNFEWLVLHENVPLCEIDQLERIEIAKFNSIKQGYNSREGGDSLNFLSEEIKKKIATNNAKYWKGKTFSAEHKKNLKKNHKGMLGKKHSEKTKAKVSQNNIRFWKGKKLSDEHRKKMSEARKRYVKNKRSHDSV